MILSLDTSTGTCMLWVDEDHYKWESNRDLATGLLRFINDSLATSGGEFKDVTGLVIMKGPGSFTGLRIGLTVLNTFAYANGIPIVGEAGEAWRENGKRRIERHENDKVVLPLYGSEPNISTPKH